MNAMNAKRKPSSGDRKKRVMIVDDHPMMRKGMTLLVNQQKELMVCCEAAAGAEAMELVDASAPDLAIIDVSLEGSSGLELIKDLRARHPEVLVLVLSMHDESVYAERILRAGARGYVMKSVGAKTILSAIRQVLKGGIFLSQRMSEFVLGSLTENLPRMSHAPIHSLTDREFEIFELVGEGKTVRQIAKLLHLSSKTVDTHRRNIMEKLHFDNVTGLLRHAVRWTELQNTGDVD